MPVDLAESGCCWVKVMALSPSEGCSPGLSEAGNHATRGWVKGPVGAMGKIYGKVRGKSEMPCTGDDGFREAKEVRRASEGGEESVVVRRGRVSEGAIRLSEDATRIQSPQRCQTRLERAGGGDAETERCGDFGSKEEAELATKKLQRRLRAGRVAGRSVGSGVAWTG